MNPSDNSSRHELDKDERYLPRKLPSDSVTQTEAQVTEDTASSPINRDGSASNDGLREDLQVNRAVGDLAAASRQSLKMHNAGSNLNRGDGVVQDTPESKLPVPTTSKSMVKASRRRARAVISPNVRVMLPRKSKEKAKQMLKLIAKGIVVPKRMALRERLGRRPIRKLPLNKIRQLKKTGLSKESLLTLWRRPSKSQHTRSSDSLSEYRCPVCG